MATDPIDSEILAFYDELDHEIGRASDRGAAILAASGLELLLDRILESALVAGTFPSDAINTFSAKIWLCHAVGHLSNDERHDLTIIRKVRNNFAHDVGASLDKGPSADRCRELVLGERLYAPQTIPFLRDANNEPYTVSAYSGDLAPPPIEVTMPDPTDPRQCLVETTRALMKVLGARSLEAGVSPPTAPREYEVDEPSRLFVESIEQLVDGEDRAALEQQRQDMLTQLDQLQDRMTALPEDHELRTKFEDLEREVRAGARLDKFLSSGARFARYSYETVRETRRRQEGH